MSHKLERELERVLASPRANEDAERRALALALATLPGKARSYSRVWMLAFAGAAALGLLAVAAGALATAGALHVSLGPRSSPPLEVNPELEVPVGAGAVAAVIDHKLWLTTRSGLRIQGLPVHSATLSPHALYVAAGIGTSLVAMAPDGTRAWTHPAGGPVVAITWAPDGLRIAYVVRRGGTFQLRTIEGNGIDERLIDVGVRPVTPSWRADSLAVAYVGAGGLPVVYDFAHGLHQPETGTRAARQVAFAPRGDTLAIASAHHVWLNDSGRTVPVTGIGRCGGCDIAWAHGRLIVATSPLSGTGAVLQLFRVSANGRASTSGPIAISERLEGLDANGNGVVLAVAWPGEATRLLATAIGGTPEVLLELPAGATIDAVSVR